MLSAAPGRTPFLRRIWQTGGSCCSNAMIAKNMCFYPRVLCSHCGSPKLTWQPASGQGTVYSTTVVRRKPEQGGDYNVALVDLSEGPRMMSRVDGLAPHEVMIGMDVRAKIIDEPGHGKLLVFMPTQGGGA
jgi:uncharacterized OB-fold protein